MRETRGGDDASQRFDGHCVHIILRLGGAPGPGQGRVGWMMFSHLSRLSRLCSPPVPGTECPVSPDVRRWWGFTGPCRGGIEPRPRPSRDIAPRHSRGILRPHGTKPASHRRPRPVGRSTEDHSAVAGGPNGTNESMCVHMQRSSAALQVKAIEPIH